MTQSESVGMELLDTVSLELPKEGVAENTVAAEVKADAAEGALSVETPAPANSSGLETPDIAPSATGANSEAAEGLLNESMVGLDGGDAPSGAPSDAPSGAPSDAPSGAPGELPGELPGDAEEQSNPTLAQFMAACQEGQLETVRELIASGKVSATDTFSLQVTGLHWAAINNRLSVVKYLMENEHSRADANARGGNLNATPLHWACRNGLVYVVDYMLTHTTADAALKDSQQYNALHLAVHSSNITLVAYILLTCVGTGPGKLYIDESDGIGCTALHWAAYQGDILLVNALLRHGADVAQADRTHMTPLHWAFIRGCKPVLGALVAAGADIHVQNDKGKDLFGVARDMNCEAVWLAVLRDADRDPQLGWAPRQHLVSERAGLLVIFFTPYVVLPVVWNLCTFLAGYAPAKVAGAAMFVAVVMAALQWLVVPHGTPLAKTPFLAGVFSATTFWCVVTWVGAVLPTVGHHEFLRSLVLAAAIGVLSYCFFKAMFINPGFVPVPSDRAVVLAQVKDLIRIGKFDTEHFCVNLFVRKPLRSKYSKFNARLVARFDHFCPWVYNDIGVRNHKLFVTFVYALAVAIVLYTLLALDYFDAYAERLGNDSDVEDSCSLLSDELCLGYVNNPFVFNLTIWCWLQLVWLAFLALVQTFQIFKGLTTWEFGNFNRRISSPAYNHSTVPRDFDVPGAPTPSAMPAMSAHGHTHGLGTCAKLLGLDQFAMTVKMALLSAFQKTTLQEYHALESYDIPTDFGWKQNWLDFWFIGPPEWRNLFFLPIEGENNLNGQVVDYYKLFEYPAKNTGLNAV